MIDSRSPNHFYETLFQIVEQKAAVKFDPETLTAIIGFGVGGPSPSALPHKTRFASQANSRCIRNK
jgi:hypothetical protein